MRPMLKGLIVAALHVGLVGSLGAKLLMDRATRPRVWVRCAPFDPDLPIRGRYVRLQMIVDAPDVPRPAETEGPGSRVPVILAVLNDRLVARPDTDPARHAYDSGPQVTFRQRDTSLTTVVDEPVAFFIPEQVRDPSFRAPGEELWVEVTLPKRGPPRPIRLGVRKDGALSPLDLR